MCISVFNGSCIQCGVLLFSFQVFQVSEQNRSETWCSLQVTGLWGQCERQYVSPTPSSYIILKISKGRRYSYASAYGGAWHSNNKFVASAEHATNFPIYCCSFCSWHLLRYASTFELAPVVQGVAATMTTFHEQGLIVRSELNLFGEALYIVSSTAE